MAEALQGELKAAQDLAESSPASAIAQLHSLVVGTSSPNDVESVKVKEDALQKLTDLLVKQRDAAALRQLLVDLRPLFLVIPKAKTAKIVRTVIDSIAKVPGSTQLQVRWRGGARTSGRGLGGG